MCVCVCERIWVLRASVCSIEKAITEEKRITKKWNRVNEHGVGEEKSERIKSGIQPNGKRHKIAIKAVASENENPLCMYIQKCFKWIKYIQSE